jgi:GntR family transcriptional regulator, transcriptional repressor for pyruvate dehydrogenase complex
VSAIVTQDPDTARTTSNALLVYIETTLLDINQRDTAVQRAMRRIDVNSN